MTDEVQLHLKPLGKSAQMGQMGPEVPPLYKTVYTQPYSLHTSRIPTPTGNPSLQAALFGVDCFTWLHYT
jgi:hypothetical protein